MTAFEERCEREDEEDRLAKLEAEREAEREALRREARQEALLDAGPILAEYRRAKGE